MIPPFNSRPQGRCFIFLFIIAIKFSKIIDLIRKLLYYIIMDTNNGVYRVDIKDISCGAFDCDAEGVRHKKILTSFSVVQSVRGSYDIRVGDSDFYSTGELGVFLAPADVTQEIVHHNGAGGTMEAQWVFIDAVINEAFCLDEYFSFPVLLSEKYGEEIYGILQQLRLSENYFKKMRAAYRLMEILAAEGQRRKNFDPLRRYPKQGIMAER